MKYRKRISLKLISSGLLFGLLAFLLIGIVGTLLLRRQLALSAASELYTIANRLASVQSRSYSTARGFTTEQLSLASDLTDYRILIVDTAQTVVFDSQGSGSLKGRKLAGFNPADNSAYYRMGRFYDAFPEDKVSVIAAVSDGYAVRGYVTLHQPMTVTEARANRVIGLFYLISAGLLLLGLLVFLGYQVITLRPLRTILAGVEEFSAGHLDHRIPVKRRDELGYLAAMLNQMAADLQSSGDYQKRFIANVSHDFRSPLTSIRGYLQAMLDGVIPEEERGRYMQVIIEETERLTKLTQEVLSLNSLDSRELSLNRSNFDLVEAVKNTCRTFEGICRGHNIGFELVFSQPVIPVHADPDKIRQVLYNLIDNAVKFSPDDSAIRIRLYRLGDKAAVSVKDYGIGISPDELKLIWNRFYKSDASRGRDKKGTGLGLSIVKEILTAHGETIDVTSTPGSGTEFVFRLPLAREEADG